ncbi:hypothetical protein OI18_11785 [Flavihumibacter solisilvae]|uniref:O-antigen ligase-related domain-containing protein n=1 Tax=Flavihumibacter solisilvae TaxID=1349421 RepID=A0A0C1IJD7_9BACT|nr:hypothetical protein OI18_11785 [Flavihumibacter solisilvae]
MAVLAFFPFHLIRTEEKNKLYIKYVLFFLPWLFIDMVPKSFYFSFFHVLTYTYFIFFLIFNKPGRNTEYAYITYLLLVLLVAGVLHSEFVDKGLQHLLRFMSYVIFCKVLITECMVDRKFESTVMNWMKVGLLFSVFFMVMQMLFGVEIVRVFGFYSEAALNPNILSFAGIRYPSFFQDPQKYAQYLAAISFFFLADIKKTDKFPIVPIALFVLSVVALFFTGARAAFLGLCAGLAFILLFLKMEYKMIFLAFIAVVIPILWIFKDDFVLFNRDSTVIDMYDTRSVFWDEGLVIFSEQPMLGIGVGNYQDYVGKHYVDQYWISEGEITYYDQPESGYLKYLVEYGVLGFIPFMAFFIIPVLKGIRYIFTRQKDFTSIVLIASLISWLIGFITVCSFTDIRMCVVIGAITCLLISRIESLNQEWKHGNE